MLIFLAAGRHLKRKSLFFSIVVRHSEEIRWGRMKLRDLSLIQRNLGLDFVTKQHKSLQKFQPVYSLVQVTC